MNWSKLKLPELLFTLIAIDCTSSALVIVLADKEALAAGKLVYVINVAQLLALVAIGYVMGNLSALQNPGRFTFGVIWWGGAANSSLGNSMHF